MTADATFWDKIAERYAAQPVENMDAFRRKIAITVERLTPASVVVDIGCGTGSLALKLAPHVAEAHGVDISSEMVRIARGKAQDQGVENATFHCGPVDALPFDPESLDMVCAYSILHLVGDLEGVLRGVFDQLKPGGHFVASTVCLSGSWVPYGLILAVMRWVGKAPRVEILSQGELEDTLRKVGFVDIQAMDVGAKATTIFHVARKPA